MNKYELTVVMEGKASPAKKKTVRGMVEKTITSLKGKIGSVEDWGEKQLSYKIEKSESGILMFFPLELDPENAKALSTKLNQEEEIIRHLLLRKN